MNIELIFPFYKESKVIKSYNVEEFDLHSDRYIFELEKNEYLIDTTNKYHGDKNFWFKIYRIIPNDVYVFGGQDPMARIYLCSAKRPRTIRAQVTELDYGRLAKYELSVEEIDNQPHVVRKLMGGYDVRPVIDTSFIEKAFINESSEATSLKKGVDSLLENSELNKAYVKSLTEAFPSGTTGLISSQQDADFGFNTSPYLQVLKHYFSNRTPTEKIPLLVGISGIAKSATIKDLSEEFDYRMVDLRASFLSRLDVDGMKDIIDMGDGTNVAEPAPTMEFLTCTDEYLVFARGMKEKVKAKISNIKNMREDIEILEDEDNSSYDENPLDSLSGNIERDREENRKNKVVALEKILEKFEYASKPPVLFLDEITRSDKSIRGALTTIINQRLYGTRSLNECRIVAATNAPVGYKDSDLFLSLQTYFEEHFLANEMTDVAVLDRFDKLLMSPKDVYPDWIKWAKAPKETVDPITGKKTRGGDLHKLVLSFIDKNGGLDVAYDLSPINRGAPSEEIESGVRLPIIHSTFRAWTMISDYLKNKSALPASNPSYQTFLPGIISGLIGEQLTEKFVDHLTKNNWKELVFTKKDAMNNLIEECLDNDIPLSIVGASGLGKTARVMKYAKNKRGYEVELLPLSTKTRIDIMGIPSTANIFDYIVGDEDPNGMLKNDTLFMDDVTQLREEANLPDKITRRAPEGDLMRKIKKCIEDKTPLVLFFDEFNRSIDPVVQTAIFQAISDGQFAGVTFPKGLIKVVLAGNPGDDKTGEAGDIDTALTARTVHFRQLGYTDDDVESFFEFAREDAWKEDPKGSSAPKWVKPKTEKEGYAKNVVVTHEGKTWKSVIHQNIFAPGEWSSGMSRVLLEYLENHKDDVLDILKSVEKAAIDTNTTSTRSLKMLSDLLDNFTIDGTLNGTLLLPNDVDRSNWSSFAKDDEDTFSEILVKIYGRIDNWSALKSGLKYVSRGGTSDLAQMVALWKNEYKDYKAGVYDVMSQLGQEMYEVTTNFLSIDDAIKLRRVSLIETKVDTTFAKTFLSYYNTVSGINKNLTIQDIVNENVIDDYLDQIVAEVGGIDEYIQKNTWTNSLIEAYDFHGDGVSINYMKMIDYFSRNIQLRDFQVGINFLIIDSKGSLIIKTIEAGLLAELKANSYDKKILEDHVIYTLIGKLKYDKILMKEFLDAMKAHDPDFTGGEDEVSLQGLGS